MKNPENMNRKEKLAAISALARAEGYTEAYFWWMRNAPRISREAFERAAAHGEAVKQTAHKKETY